MKKMPFLYTKVLEIIRASNTDKKNKVEADITRKFRLSKEDADYLLKEFHRQGIITRSRFKIVDNGVDPDSIF